MIFQVAVTAYGTRSNDDACVGSPAQKGFEFERESRLVEEAGALPPRHKQIDVAVRAGFASRHRSDQLHLGGAVARGDAEMASRFSRIVLTITASGTASSPIAV